MAKVNRGRLRLVEGDVPVDAPVDPPRREHAAEAETPPPPAIAVREPLRADPRPSAVEKSRTGLDALSDAQLVALGCDGERGALEVLYRRHAPFAINLATRIEGAARDVEDIVHDAFIRAFDRLGDLSDRGAFKSWLGAIVVHGVRSRMRRQRFMNVFGLSAGPEAVDLDAIASPDASPHVRAQIAQIYALLRTLPTDERIAWTLRSVEGHDLETVARLTRCSLATAKRRIARTQRFLDGHFIDHGVSPAAVSSDAPSPSKKEAP